MIWILSSILVVLVFCYFALASINRKLRWFGGQTLERLDEIAESIEKIKEETETDVAHHLGSIDESLRSLNEMVKKQVEPPKSYDY